MTQSRMDPAARLLAHRIPLEEKKVTEATGTSVQRGLDSCLAQKPTQLQGWAQP